MPKVKICGLTNLDDALVAAEEGADFLGFIIWPQSKRAVDAKQVLCMVEHLRSLENCPTLVGVFVDDSAEIVAQTLDYCGLDLAQLHGGEPPSYIGDADSPLYGRAYKAIRPQSYLEAEADAEWFLPPVTSEQLTVNSKQSSAEDHATRNTLRQTQDAAQHAAQHAFPQLLIDAYHPTLVGGTGEVSDWDIASRITHHAPRLLLAGGLTPANVAQAIAETNTWGVDVASGVEASYGKKDHAVLRTFIHNAKNL